MQRLLLNLFGLTLAGCSALTSKGSDFPSETEFPIVVIQTILVKVLPSPKPTLATTQTLAPRPTPPVLFVSASPAAAVIPQEGNATARLPANPGGGVFTNLTRSSDRLSLRCQPNTLVFSLSAINPSVSGVDFWFRIQDRLTVSISDWQNGGAMEPNYAGDFIISFPASRVDTEIRSHKAWFDYQFVGVNKLGDVVGRSAKITQQVTYTIDCKD